MSGRSRARSIRYVGMLRTQGKKPSQRLNSVKSIYEVPRMLLLTISIGKPLVHLMDGKQTGWIEGNNG